MDEDFHTWDFAIVGEIFDEVDHIEALQWGPEIIVEIDGGQEARLNVLHGVPGIVDPYPPLGGPPDRRVGVIDLIV